MVTVADLRTKVPNDSETLVVESFANVGINASGDVLSVGDFQWVLEEEGHEALSKSLGIPANFLAKPKHRGLRKTVYDHFFSPLRDKETEFTFQATENGLFTGAYPSNKPLIPRDRVLHEVIEQIFTPEDVVKRIDTFNGALELDIITERRLVEPRVGDYTAGGIRLISYLSPSVARRAPSVGFFAERYVCTNGMTRDYEGGGKGFLADAENVDDVIRLMETAARNALDEVQPWLDGFASTAEIPVENPAAHIRRTGQRYGLPAGLILSLEDQSAGLPQPVMLYDVLNLITEVQNTEGCTSSIREKVMAIGGDMAAESQVRHCVTCGSELDHTH